MLPRLLLVDDDDGVRASLADALSDGTICVTEAASAEDAIRIVEEQGPPEVVLTDIRMRRLDGLDLLRIVRDRAPSSHVVIMTAYHDVGTAVTAMREGAADFLCKPFDLATLRDVLGPLLGSPGGGGPPVRSPAGRLASADAPAATRSGAGAPRLGSRYEAGAGAGSADGLGEATSPPAAGSSDTSSGRPNATTWGLSVALGASTPW